MIGLMMMAVIMSMRMPMVVVMPVLVGVAADFHVVAAETASAFFAHKILFVAAVYDRRNICIVEATLTERRYNSIA